VQKYNLTLLVTADDELNNYLNSVVNQVRGMFSEVISFLTKSKECQHSQF